MVEPSQPPFFNTCMKKSIVRTALKIVLPASLRPLFWEYEFKKLSWEHDSDLITSRILSVGNIEDWRWLQQIIGRHGIREHILKHRGRGLDRRQLRFWQVLVDLPGKTVDLWLAEENRKVWDQRANA